jgi:hypothetical protein
MYEWAGFELRDKKRAVTGVPCQSRLHGKNTSRFFEIASMSSWFPTLVDAHGPLECRPTALITQSVVLNLRRLNEVGRLRCHGIAMMEATHATE